MTVVARLYHTKAPAACFATVALLKAESAGLTAQTPAGRDLNSALLGYSQYKQVLLLHSV